MCSRRRAHPQQRADNPAQAGRITASQRFLDQCQVAKTVLLECLFYFTPCLTVAQCIHFDQLSREHGLFEMGVNRFGAQSPALRDSRGRLALPKFF